MKKYHGHMGVLDLKLMNNALLVKWLWKYRDVYTSVLKQIIQVKHTENISHVFYLHFGEMLRF